MQDKVKYHIDLLWHQNLNGNLKFVLHISLQINKWITGISKKKNRFLLLPNILNRSVKIFTYIIPKYLKCSFLISFNEILIRNICF